MTFALSHQSCTQCEARTLATPTSFFTSHILSLSHTLLFQHLDSKGVNPNQVPTIQRMASSTQSWRLQKTTIVLFLLCISFSSSVVAQPADTEIKCGSCPCGNTCGDQSPPLPPPPCSSPPPPPPPPPSPLPPPSPPPPPKYPSCPQNCNPLPPPPPRFIYVPVPGVNQPKPYWIYYYSAAANRDVGFLVLALGGLSMAMVFCSCN